jgi:hypothetical protein
MLPRQPGTQPNPRASSTHRQSVTARGPSGAVPPPISRRIGAVIHGHESAPIGIVSMLSRLQRETLGAHVGGGKLITVPTLALHPNSAQSVVAAAASTLRHHRTSGSVVPYSSQCRIDTIAGPVIRDHTASSSACPGLHGPPRRRCARPARSSWFDAVGTRVSSRFTVGL